MENRNEYAIKRLREIEKNGNEYISKLKDNDYKKETIKKKFLFINREKEERKISNNLADQIINRDNLFKFKLDLKDYYQTFSNNIDKSMRGFHKEIDSNKTYFIDDVNLYLDIIKKINKIYEEKKDNLEFDKDVGRFVEFLNKKIIYQNEAKGLDVKTSFKLLKMDTEEKLLHINLDNSLDRKLYIKEKKQIKLNEKPKTNLNQKLTK